MSRDRAELYTGVFACPLCGSSLSLAGGSLVCNTCGRKFGFVAGIPDFRGGSPSRRNLLWIKFYDVYSRFYDSIEHRLAVRKGFSEHELRIEIMKTMGLRNGLQVLEVCTGTCRNLQLFASVYSGVYVGIDASLGMLLQCLKARQDIILALAYAENLPFKSEVFDRVLIGGCLGHVSDPARVLREASRVLRRGGYLIVYDQVTWLDRLLGKHLAPLEYKPRGLRLIGYRLLYNGLFYIARFRKERESMP